MTNNDITNETQPIKDQEQDVADTGNGHIVASKKQAFLAVYAQTGNLSEAAKAVGMHRNTHYRWLREDEDYAAAYEAAQFEVGDTLEAEAIRRANAGSDTLLIFLLKGFKPDKYKERISSSVEHKNRVYDPGRDRLTDEQLDLLIAAAQRFKAKRIN